MGARFGEAALDSVHEGQEYFLVLGELCEGFNDWGGRGYDDFVPGEVTKTAPSQDETT